MKLAGWLVAFVAFTVFSMWVVATRGYLGFLELARDDRWALQMLIDLAIACSFAIGWMIHDARRRGLSPWPYVAAVIPLGSVGVLAYMVRRSVAAYQRSPSPAPSQASTGGAA